MNMVIKKTQWMCASLLIALTSGAPAYADDTEILLINPNKANPPKPNLMFIIDSSGSMDNMVESKLPYDSALPPYPQDAGCDPDRLYWTLVGSTPSCDATNTQFIQKTAFACAAANRLITGIGSFTDTMSHFRGDGTGSAAWQAMQPGNNLGIVECEDDNAIHGIGASPGTAPFAQKGATLVAYTSDPGQVIDWTGDGVVSESVTVYDGNYLNYRAVPVTVDARKIDIVQDVVGTVLSAISNVNVGIMRFNDSAGGPVIQDIVDLDQNRTAIIAAVDSILPAGRTPLSETLYESARFWRGMPAYYGETINEHTTDLGALSQESPEIYEQPAMTSCTKNFNVLLTDGEPNTDGETPSLVNHATWGLPNWSSALGGRVGCTFNIEGDCLDDVAEYLFKEDINSTLAGDQSVTTHTIGFAINLPVMAQTAALSGGEYFLADDVESLTLALLKIVAIVQDRSLSFTAPAVAVNSFNRTRNLNDLYLTTFGARGKVHWPGNVKKYEIKDGQIVDKAKKPAVDPATGFFVKSAQNLWSPGPDGLNVEIGGAANLILPPGSRNLYTYNGSDKDLFAGSNHISTMNSGAFTLTDFGLIGAASEPDVDEMILWARGADQADEDGDGDLTEPRNDMGDPLHSQPAAVVYGGTAGNPDTIVFAATNDGYLHAIDGKTGVELWAFVPKEHLASFSKLYSNLDSKLKNYGIDGDIIPITKDVDGDGVIETGDGDFVYIIFGMRRGGGKYYALDVTRKALPKLLWEFGDASIGQSWSSPSIARVDMPNGFGLNTDKAIVVIGGGYDTAHDTIAHPAGADGFGSGIYFLDLKTGSILWRAKSSGAQLNLPKMTRAIPSSVRVIDLNGDGFADRMYASDLGGQIWRFDITSGNAPNGLLSNALVAGGVIAQLGAEGNTPTTDAETRRFYGSPDVSLFNDNAQNRRFIALSIGSGYRAHPLDNTTNERFYSIRDRNVFGKMTQNEYDTFTPTVEANLVEISGSIGSTISVGDHGWMFTLPANQKVLVDSATFDNEIFFVAFSPDPDNVAAVTCTAGVGRNFLYRVSVVNGDPVGDLSNVISGSEDSLRVHNLKQGGIAPSPRFLFPTPDPNCVVTAAEDCEEPPLSCVGVECFDPGFENNPVRTLWTQDGIE